MKILNPTRIFSYFFCFSIISCGEVNRESKNTGQQEEKYRVDTSAIAILPYHTVPYAVFTNVTEADLTLGEMERIDKIIAACIRNYNSEQEKRFEKINCKYPVDEKDFIIELSRYKRQYIAVLNEKQEKEVWVNCFCTGGGTDWKNMVLLVLDGGNCFFNLKINLESGRYYDFIVNGHA